MAEKPPSLVPRGARFAFGESPFHVKGVLYKATRTYFEQNVEGGFERLVAAVEPAPLREFIAQPFLASGRYDVMPVPALIEHEARVVGLSFEDYLLERTRWQAQQDIHGIYRLLLKLTSPERVMTRLPKVLVQMFDFPTVELRKIGERDRAATFGQVPEVLVPWLEIGFSVYAKTALSLAGADDVRVDFTGSSKRAIEAGVTLSQMKMRVRWS